MVVSQAPKLAKKLLLNFVAAASDSDHAGRDTQRDVHIAELRTQFVSSVSHELKTPLTSIRMFAEILQMRGYADPKLHDELRDDWILTAHFGVGT